MIIPTYLDARFVGVGYDHIQTWAEETRMTASVRDTSKMLLMLAAAHNMAEWMLISLLFFQDEVRGDGGGKGGGVGGGGRMAEWMLISLLFFQYDASRYFGGLGVPR